MDCDTNKIGDSLTAFLNVANFGPHSPFHFQAAANLLGPSVFNGEGPFDGTYTNGNTFSNTLTADGGCRRQRSRELLLSRLGRSSLTKKPFWMPSRARS